MQSTIKMIKDLPTVLTASGLTAQSRGSSMNTTSYLIPDAGFIAGVSGAQLTTTLGIKAPGTSGSSRAQVLSQVTLLGADGKPRVCSANLTLSIPKDFLPPAGQTVDMRAITRAVVASLIGYVTNPAGAATPAVNAVVDALYDGILP